MNAKTIIPTLLTILAAANCAGTSRTMSDCDKTINVIPGEYTAASCALGNLVQNAGLYQGSVELLRQNETTRKKRGFYSRSQDRKDNFRALRQACKEADTDGDGHITREEGSAAWHRYQTEEGCGCYF